METPFTVIKSTSQLINMMGGKARKGSINIIVVRYTPYDFLSVFIKLISSENKKKFTDWAWEY